MINKNNNGPKVYTRTYKSVHENNQDNNYKKPNYNTNNSPLPVNKVNNIRVYVEKNDKYKLPAKASIGSVGYDLFSTEDMVIPSGKAVLVPTGLKMAIPRGYEMQIRSRSGLCLNHSIMVMNSPATIDPDYRGEIQVILYN